MNPVETNSRSQRKTIMIVVGILVVLCLCLGGVGIAGGYFYLLQAADEVTGDNGVEYVLDVSGRMALPATGSTDSRLFVARSVMAEVVRPSRADVAALRVFGSGADNQACQDTDLVVPLAPANQSRIAQELSAIEGGQVADAALAEAMIAAIRDLSVVAGPRSLVVVTGGQDSCQVEAGRLIAQEATRAGIELRTFVIGFQVTAVEAEAIKEMVAATGDAVYLDAPDEAALTAALQAVQQYVDNPTNENFATVAAIEAVAGAPQPTPASPPTPSDDPTPIATTPAVTATPTSPPTATAVATATATAPSVHQPQTACDHPYFPIRPGATWTYGLMSEGESFTWTMTVIEVTGDLNEATAVMEAEFDDEFTATYNWSCSGDGVFSYDLGVFSELDLDLEGVTFSFEIVNSEGVLLPRIEEFIPGATWQNSYTINSSFAFEGQSFASSTQHSGSYTAVGYESVRVPAGQFETLRVDGRTSATTTMFGQSSSSSSRTSQWYAEGVGWVRTTEQDEDGTSTIELISYDIP